MAYDGALSPVCPGTLCRPAGWPTLILGSCSGWSRRPLFPAAGPWRAPLPARASIDAALRTCASDVVSGASRRAAIRRTAPMAHDLFTDLGLVAGLTIPYVALRLICLSVGDEVSTSYVRDHLELMHAIKGSRFVAGVVRFPRRLDPCRGRALLLRPPCFLVWDLGVCLVRRRHGCRGPVHRRRHVAHDDDGGAGVSFGCAFVVE